MGRRCRSRALDKPGDPLRGELARAEDLTCHSGLVHEHQTRNLEIPGPRCGYPGMTVSIACNRDRHFGCGTIRIYGFGDFQPCG
jgi:hypothetical protein